MKNRFYLRYLLIALMLSATSLLPAQRIDSLTMLLEETASDSLLGFRYLELAKAWFWEDPSKTDSLLKLATAHFTPAKQYGGLSDVHNFRANYHYLGGRPQAACSSLDTAMKFAALDGDSLHVIGIRKNVTILRSEAGDTEGALEAINESIEFLQRRKDTSLLAEHYTQRGLLRQLQGYRLLALDDLQIALELHRSLAETARIAEVEQRIGQVLFEEQDYASVLPYYSNAALHYQQANQQQYYAEVLTVWAATHNELGHQELADSLFTAAIALSSEIDQPYNVAHAKLLRAESWLDRGIRIAEARKDAAATLPVFAQIMPIMEGSSRLLLARIDTTTQQYASALDHVRRSIKTFGLYNDATNLKSAHQLEAEILAALGQPTAALKSYKIAQTLTDSLFGINRARAVSELNIRYGTQIKDRELELRQNRILQMKGEQENAKLQNRLLGLGLLTTLGLLLIGYYVYNLRKKGLEAELRYRKRELAAQRLHLLHKSTLLQEVETSFNTKSDYPNSKEQQKMLNSIRTQEALDQDWRTFTDYFRAVHGGFTNRLDLDFPNLTITEKRLAYLLRLGTNTAEAAALLRVQPESIRKAKYRLKKKLSTNHNNQSLEDILKTIK